MKSDVEARWCDYGTFVGLRCPIPGCEVIAQRTPGGKLRDGLHAHLRVVHEIRRA